MSYFYLGYDIYNDEDKNCEMRFVNFSRMEIYLWKSI